MKKIFIAVCVVLCGVAMTSCTDMNSVRAVYSLKLDYEKKIKDYEKLDSMTMDDVRSTAYEEAEQARKDYLEAFACLNGDERELYRKLEAECKDADKEYLGSIYEEDSVEDTKYKPIQATYRNLMK